MKRILFIVVPILIICFVLSFLLLSINYNFDISKADTLDSNSTISVGFPYYTGRDSLISENVGYFPFFENPLSTDSTKSITFSDSSRISFYTSNSTVYTRNYDYNNINYTPLVCNFTYDLNNSSRNSNFIRFYTSLKLNTTYTFAFILFSFNTSSGSNPLFVPYLESSGSQQIIDNNIVVPSSVSYNSPYIYYKTFNSSFNTDYLRLQFRGNFTASFFLVEGSTPSFLPAQRSTNIFTLNNNSLNVNPSTNYMLANGNNTYYSSTLSITDYSSFSNMYNIISDRTINGYFKFQNVFTFYIPFTINTSSSGYVLKASYIPSNNVYTLSAIINVSSTIDINIYYTRSDSDTSYLSLSNIEISLFTYNKSNYGNNSYNQGFIDGRNFSYDQIQDLTNSLNNKQAVIDSLNDIIYSQNDYTFYGLFSAVFDVPVTTFRSLLNWNFLGFNLYSFCTALLTIGILLFILRIFLKGGG